MNENAVVEAVSAPEVKKIFRVSPAVRAIWILFFLAFILSVVMVFSATEALSYRSYQGSTTYFLFKQFKMFVVCALCMLAVSFFPTSFYKKISPAALVITLVLLALTLFIGVEDKGARRALTLFDMVTLQTSELARLPIILYLATYISNAKGAIRNFSKGLLRPMVILGIMCFLVYWSGFSQTLLLGIVGITMLLMGNARVTHILFLLVLAGGLMFAAQTREISVAGIDRSKTRSGRLERWLDGSEKQANEAKMAIANGAILGQGPGHGQFSAVLSESHSDFIFAIIVEELGVLGIIWVFLLYGGLLLAIGAVMKRSDDLFSILICGGVAVSIISQALVHMFVSVGLFPVTGVNLPLISHGGTSLIVTGLLLGLVLAINRENYAKRRAVN